MVTRDPDWRADGVATLSDVAAALERAETLEGSGPTKRVFVAGGAEIYRAAWDRTDTLELTEVDQTPDGDVFFPEIDPEQWRPDLREGREGFAFVRYRRRR